MIKTLLPLRSNNLIWDISRGLFKELSLVSFSRTEEVKMAYSCIVKFLSMMGYQFPIHVLFKDFSIGRGHGGCALFSPFYFRGMSTSKAKKSGDGGGLNRMHG
ncbi:hypothetical protein RHGRI_012380 [Rhododendron griersonianum]|uniref:Uncharacterized protein n=1 Tax=Rhododendron griersonianum TaxID=479676 RepID=A0AAV6KRP8_9ERIC|nr:hypothetical protein RHGRI_012380 [Rhododendron griersonianum]